MALKISQLTAASASNLTDISEVSQSDGLGGWLTRKVTAQQILNLIIANIDTINQNSYSVDTTLTNPIAYIQILNFSASGKSVILPAMNSVSSNVKPGQTLVFVNNGSFLYSVKANGGSLLANILPGQVASFYMESNVTADGTFDVRKSYGLFNQTVSAGRSVVSTDRLSWLDCTANLALSYDDATNLGNGFSNYVTNTGSGNVTILPFSGQTINGSNTLTIYPMQAYQIACDGINLKAIGACDPGLRFHPNIALNSTIDLPFGNPVLLYNVISFTGAGHKVTLPVMNIPGVSLQPGVPFVFYNPGTFDFNIVAQDGSTVIATVSAGTREILFLRNNSSANGTWDVFSIGGIAGYNSNNIAITGGTISGASISSGTIDSTPIGTIIPVQIQGKRPTNAQTGTTYTLVIADACKRITQSNASAITTTIPTNASVSFTNDTDIDFLQLGAGQVTLVPAGGVTLNSYLGLTKIAGQYAGANLSFLATNVCYLVGNLG